MSDDLKPASNPTSSSISSSFSLLNGIGTMLNKNIVQFVTQLLILIVTIIYFYKRTNSLSQQIAIMESRMQQLENTIKDQKKYINDKVSELSSLVVSQLQEIKRPVQQQMIPRIPQMMQQMQQMPQMQQMQQMPQMQQMQPPVPIQQQMPQQMQQPSVPIQPQMPQQMQQLPVPIQPQMPQQMQQLPVQHPQQMPQMQQMQQIPQPPVQQVPHSTTGLMIISEVITPITKPKQNTTTIVEIDDNDDDDNNDNNDNDNDNNDNNDNISDERENDEDDLDRELADELKELK